MTYDVAIAGAGLAGGSLAWRLAAAGLRVALFDAQRFPRPKLCGEYVSPEGVLALERLGLGDDLAGLGGHPIRRVRLSTPRGSILEAQVADRDGRPGLGISRSALDDRLAARARAQGVALFQGHRVAGPLVAEGRVVGLDVRDAANRPIEVRATVAIAADGRGSALVRRTGRTTVRSRVRRGGLFGLKRHLRVTDEAAAEPPGVVGLHMVPGGYGGTCRIDGGLTNFCALLPDSALKRHRGDLDRLADDLLARNPVLAALWSAAEPVGDWKTVAGVRVETARPDLPGIFYAGDCRGTVDPLGGQGMTMALLGAETLAPFVAQAVAAGTADAALQRRYEACWEARFGRRIRLCRAFHHALIHPAGIDLLATLGPLAARGLAACYDWTRDPAAPTVAADIRRPIIATKPTAASATSNADGGRAGRA